MALQTWWRTDPLPVVTAPSGVTVTTTLDTFALARVVHLAPTEVERRRMTGHVPYVARINSYPVAYGWVAYETAEIGELGLHLQIPAGNRYLWDFGTVPAWRGNGLYPYLLQNILRNERAEQFWILHAPENHASGRGITKAGFQVAGNVSFRANGAVGLTSAQLGMRALVGAVVLGVPTLDPVDGEALTPCWGCTLALRQRLPHQTSITVMCGPECLCAAP